MKIPTTINGVEGETDSALMRRRVTHTDTYDEDGMLHDSATAVEWYLDGELVHRSAHVMVWRTPEEMKSIAGLAAAANDNGKKESRA